jgi:hypothetical protein
MESFRGHVPSVFSDFIFEIYGRRLDFWVVDIIKTYKTLATSSKRYAQVCMMKTSAHVQHVNLVSSVAIVYIILEDIKVLFTLTKLKVLACISTFNNAREWKEVHF